MSKNMRCMKRRQMAQEKKDAVVKMSQIMKDLKAKLEERKNIVDATKKLNAEPIQVAGRDENEPMPKKLKTCDIYSHDDKREVMAKSGKRPDRRSIRNKENVISSKMELIKVMLQRHTLERWVHMPFFVNAVIGCFVRIGIGSNNGDPIYQVAEIVDVIEMANMYQLGATRTNKGLRLRLGRDENVIRLEYVSNQNLSDKEFSHWKDTAAAHGQQLPTTHKLEKKIHDLEDALKYQYKVDKVKEIDKDKDCTAKIPANYATNKIEKWNAKTKAVQLGKHVVVHKLQKEMFSVERCTSNAIKNYTQLVTKPSNNLIKKHAKGKGQKKGDPEIRDEAYDPFTRRKCAPILITSTSASQANLRKQHDQEAKIEATKSETSLRNKIRLKDDVYMIHDFKIKTDIDSSPTTTDVSTATKSSCMPTKVGNPKRKLSLEDYKKRRALI